MTWESLRAELIEAKERIAELEAALNKAKKMHDWFTHTVPQWDKSTQKAMEEFDKALAATQAKGGTR